jgi:AsmA protein
MAKKLLFAGVAVAGLLIVLVAGVFLFLDANQFRPKLEVMMADALGRRVTIGHLSIALLSGGIAADDLMIADDPAFSRQPFVTARSVTVGVDLMPLILSRSLRVQSFRLNQPSVTLLRSASGVWNFSGLSSAASSPGSSGAGVSGTAMSVLVQKIAIAGGQIVVGVAGRESRTYDAVNVEVSDLSFTSRFPFAVTAKTPGGGTISVEGTAGPFNAKNIAETPYGGTISVKHLDLASTGFVDSGSGPGGIVDFSGALTSDGVLVKTQGKLSASGVQLLRGGAASRVPITIDYDTTYNSRSQTGTLRQGDVSIGKAMAHLTGGYDNSGKAPSVRMTLAGPQMAVTELQAALPAIGVTLPSGATLKQGALDTNLTIAGPVDRLTIAGPVKLSNGTLAGFDLGGKLGALASFAGVQSGKDTIIELLSASLRLTPAGTEISMLNMNVPSIGTLTGDGTITPAGAIDFAMLAKPKSGELAPAAAGGGVARAVSFAQASGIPFRIQGTTSNPVFVPDMSRAMKNAASELKETVSSPENLKKAADAISGLFGRKKP